ncbi:circadian input kinase A [Pseudanabaena sp. lw0831]|uniref:GAF domain-containing protein n=1 Tax=Pseudanabaena sp. lw0831 TaxID=1357935 RepID=UPI0019150EF0|nr:GAF domain-containing protein [Pseudanabaena sp. lw0831]GBO52121.1 circadian input kinase A [Pseudanabaena sp. lw0831]
MNKFIASSERKVLIITDSYDELVRRKLLPCDGTIIVEYRQNRYQIQQCESPLLISLEIYLQEAPDCVLLDWELPNLDGIEILQILNSKQIPVVILVSAANEELVSRIEQDYHDYLVKETLTKELIFSALRNAIAQEEQKQNLIHNRAAVLLEKQNRQQVELSLQESQQFIQKIADASPNILYLYNVQEQRNIYSNREIYATLGYTPQEIQEMGANLFHKVMHPEDLDKVAANLELICAAADGEIIDMEYRMRHANGEWRWLYSRNSVFSRDDSGEVLITIGTAQDITDRKLAEIKLQQQANHQSLISSISRRIRASLNLEETLNTTVAEIHQVLQSDRVLVCQIYADRTRAVIAESISPRFASMLDNIYFEGTLSEEMYDNYLNGEIYCLEDIKTGSVPPCLLESLQELEVRAKVVVPIIQDQQLWGMLIVHQCDRPRTWQEWEIDLLQQLSSRFAIAIQRANLFNQLQLELRDRQSAEKLNRQQSDREAFQHEIMQRIRQSLDLHTIFDTATLEIRQFLHADRVGIFKFAPEFSFTDGEFVAESVAPEFDSVVAAKFHDDCFGEQYSESYYHGRFQAVDDIYNAGLHQCHIDILSVFQIRANLVMPLLNGNDLWGLLCIHQCSAPRHWETEEITLVQKISHQLAIAIQQASVYQQLQLELRDRQRAEQLNRQQANRESLLHDLMQRIRQSLDLHTIFDTATLEIHQFLQADRVGIYKFTPNTNFIEGEFVAESVVDEFDSVITAKLHEDRFGGEYAESYRLGRFQAVDDIYNAGLTPCHIDILSIFQIRAHLVVPLLNGNDLWGLLCIHQCSAPRHWEAEEISLVKQISNQLAIAIQQASLYQQVQEELANKEALYLQLANELHQKKVLLKEVHHRVKNNLQVMSSLLRMQFRKTTPELKILIEEYQNRIQSMALIHAQLHNNEDLANINFRDYISDLIANLFQCYVNHSEHIQYKLDVINIFLPLEQSIPLGLIINELISNTLKYAFPHGSGEINIQLTQTENQYHLIVADDGIGLPPDLDLANTESLGMQLVHSLTDQLEGTLLYNGENGTKFQVFFPVL